MAFSGITTNLVGFPSLDVAEEIKIIREVGFVGVFSVWEKENRQLCAKIARLCRENDLAYTSIHAPSHHVSGLWREGQAGEDYLSLLFDCLEDCATLGVPTMVLHAKTGFREHTPTPIGLDRFGRLIDRADLLGVRLGFENLEGEAYLDAVIRTFGAHPSVGFCFDCGHEFCYNKVDMLSLYGDRLCYLHIHDNYGPLPVDDIDKTGQNDLHLVPFDGKIDYQKVISRIRATGYSGYLTCELKIKGLAGEKYGTMTPSAFYRYAFERMSRLNLL